MSDLADFYAPDELPQHDDDRWQVRSDRECEWALLKLARAEQELARIKERADELRAAADLFQRTASAGPARDADFFRGACADYHRRNLQPVVDDITADGVVDKDAWQKVKGKTYPLPFGQLKASRSQDKVVIEDEEAFVGWAWAEGHFALLNVKPSLSALKASFQVDGRVVIDGEVVPGVRVEGGTVTFDAKATVTDEIPAYLPAPTEDVA